MEPIITDHLDLNPLMQDYPRFADLNRGETAESLASMHADIAWRSKNWRSGIAPLKAGLEARGS